MSAKKNIILGIFILLFMPLFSQSTFYKTYDEVFLKGKNIFELNDHSFDIIVSGSSTNFNNSNLGIIHLSNSGDTLWTKPFGNKSIYQIYNTVNTPENEFIICTRTTTGKELLINKVNIDGDSLWSRSYGSGLKHARSLCASQDSGAFITGFDENDNIFLLKINSEGDSLWVKTYYLNSNSSGECIGMTRNENYIIGAAVNGTQDLYYPCLIEVNSQGDTLWTNTYCFFENTRVIRSVYQTENNSYFVLMTNLNYSEIYIMQTDAAGDTLWTRTLNISGVSNLQKAIYTKDNGHLIIASKRIDNRTQNILLIKLDQYGDIEWSREYGNIQNYGFIAEDVTITSEDNIILTGSYSYDDGMDGFDIPKLFVIKTDSLGQVFESNVQEMVVCNFTLSQNRPNPLNPTTTISYDLPEARNIKLQVFDITGRLVETLYNGYKQAGHWDVKWDAGNQSSGVYIYRLQVGDRCISKKMVVLK